MRWKIPNAASSAVTMENFWKLVFQSELKFFFFSHLPCSSVTVSGFAGWWTLLKSLRVGECTRIRLKQNINTTLCIHPFSHKNVSSSLRRSNTDSLGIRIFKVGRRWKKNLILAFEIDSSKGWIYDDKTGVKLKMPKKKKTKNDQKKGKNADLPSFLYALIEI